MAFERNKKKSVYTQLAPTKIVICDSLEDSVDELANTVTMPSCSATQSMAINAKMPGPASSLSSKKNNHKSAGMKKRKKSKAAAAAAASLILRGGTGRNSDNGSRGATFYKTRYPSNPSKSMNSITCLYEVPSASNGPLGSHRVRNQFDKQLQIHSSPNQEATSRSRRALLPNSSSTTARLSGTSTLRRNSASATSGMWRDVTSSVTQKILDSKENSLHSLQERPKRNWRQSTVRPSRATIAGAANANKLQQFEVLGVLGKGAFAECDLVKRKSDGTLFALKKFHMPMSGLSASEREEAVTEVRVLSNLVHDNILQYEDSFLQNGAMHIVMQYADGGTIEKIIKNHKLKKQKIPENTIWNLLLQLLRALKYCHGLGIMHRDIKPQNVMLHKKSSAVGMPVVLLGDFGIAKILSHQNAETNEQCGTPYYYSPEICKGEARDPKGDDLWAVGVMLFELMTLKRPFVGENTFNVMHNIIFNKRPPIPTEGYSADLSKICATLLQTDPNKRCFAAELLDWPCVIKQAERYDLMRSKLARKSIPKQRLQEIMATLKRIQRQAATLKDDEREECMARIRKIETEVANNHQLQTAEVYNKLGGVKAEIGSFQSAISNFQQAADSSDPCEVDKKNFAKEQIANLLVRTAFSKWEKSPDHYPSAKKMFDRGLMLLEEVCLVKESGERRALLGSAYKRGFVMDNCANKKFLTQAVESYYKAAALQSEVKKNGCYAMLNALTLQMLSGVRELDDLLVAARSLYTKTLLQQEANPADQWLWVQVADALCLRYLLLDSQVSKALLEGCYTKTLVFGASKRVKKSVEDQLFFMKKTLGKRMQDVIVSGISNVELDEQCKRIGDVCTFMQSFQLQETPTPSRRKSVNQTDDTDDAGETTDETANNKDDVTDAADGAANTAHDTTNVTDSVTKATDSATSNATHDTKNAMDGAAKVTDGSTKSVTLDTANAINTGDDTKSATEDPTNDSIKIPRDAKNATDDSVNAAVSTKTSHDESSEEKKEPEDVEESPKKNSCVIS